MTQGKYKMRVVRGAFENQSVLDELGAEVIEDLPGDDWVSIDEVTTTTEQIKELQKQMIKHFSESKAPWYMDGNKEENKDELIVAFGADDGEGGKIFEFNKNNKDDIKKVVDYGVSKGIPAEQMDFWEIKF